MILSSSCFVLKRSFRSHLTPRIGNRLLFRTFLHVFFIIICSANGKLKMIVKEMSKMIYDLETVLEVEENTQPNILSQRSGLFT